MISMRLQKQINFLVEIDKLKKVLRQTLLIADPKQRENDAEHSWHLAMLIIVLGEYAEEKVDLLHCLKLILIHDLVEIDAGDTFAYDSAGYADKELREKQAAKRIFGLLPDDQAKEIAALWEEFEEGSSPEARFAVAVDRLQPFLHNMHTQGGTWALHNITKEQVIQRMLPIKAASSTLWSFIKDQIEQAQQKGYIALPATSDNLLCEENSSDR